MIFFLFQPQRLKCCRVHVEFRDLLAQHIWFVRKDIVCLGRCSAPILRVPNEDICASRTHNLPHTWTDALLAWRLRYNRQMSDADIGFYLISIGTIWISFWYRLSAICDENGFWVGALLCKYCPKLSGPVARNSSSYIYFLSFCITKAQRRKIRSWWYEQWRNFVEPASLLFEQSSRYGQLCIALCMTDSFRILKFSL